MQDLGALALFPGDKARHHPFSRVRFLLVLGQGLFH